MKVCQPDSYIFFLIKTFKMINYEKKYFKHNFIILNLNKAFLILQRHFTIFIHGDIILLMK